MLTSKGSFFFCKTNDTLTLKEATGTDSYSKASMAFTRNPFEKATI